MTDAPKGKQGPEPFAWTDEIETELLNRIGRGESVRSICRDDWLPGQTTFYKRLAEDEEFAKRYAHAREIQAHTIAEECLEIADSRDADVTLDTDGNEQVNHDAIARAKLRIDTRKWMAGKLAPKVYGDKQIIEGSGKGGAVLIDAPELTPLETARRMAFVFASALQEKPE